MTRLLPTLRAGAAPILAVLALLAAVPASAGPWTGNVSAFLGQKLMDKDSWEPADEMQEFGVLIDVRDHERYPLSVAVDLFRARESAKTDTFSLSVQTYELHLGARMILNDKDQETWFRPYLGAGLSLAAIDVDLNRNGRPSDKDQEYRPGAWAGGGIYISPFPNFNIGFDARWSTVPVKLLGDDFDAGGLHLGILVGWRWLAI